MRVWIETMLNRNYLVIGRVTLRVRVWIET